MEEFTTLSSGSGTAPAASGGGFESIWMALARSERVELAEAADASSHDYHPELATPELIVQIRRLLAAERRAGRLVCRYLADLADRIHGQRDRELLAYVDEFQAAAVFFDLGAREVRERVRIGRALRQLPQIEAAFIAGELSYSRVREVTRVAEPNTESAWLECARDLDMRALERRVAGTAEQLAARQRHFDDPSAETLAAAGGRIEPFDTASAHFGRTSADGRGVADGPIEGLGDATAHAPSSPRTSGPDERASRVASRERGRVHTRWLDHDSLRVTFELPAEAWALLERALECARQKAATPLADAEALAAVARDALASQNQAADASDPRCSVVVYECRSCSKSELDTGVGPFELEPTAAATLGCGAREVDLDSEGRGVQRGGPLPAAIRRAVLLRDRCRCRVPGCNRRRYVDVHHLVARSDGGEHSHSRSNCITLCSTHHRRLHEGKLLITGDADAEPVFRDAAQQTVASFDEQGGARAARREADAWNGENSSAPAALRERSSNRDNSSAPAALQQRSSDREGTSAQRRGGGHASGPAWREQHANDDERTSAQPRRHGADAGDGENDWATARRELQCNHVDVDVDVDDGATHLGTLNGNALGLLQIMGRRGNWTSDVLLERSALPFPEFQHALLLLELEGRVRRRGCEFDPV